MRSYVNSCGGKVIKLSGLSNAILHSQAHSSEALESEMSLRRLKIQAWPGLRTPHSFPSRLLEAPSLVHDSFVCVFAPISCVMQLLPPQNFFFLLFHIGAGI